MNIRLSSQIDGRELEIPKVDVSEGDIGDIVGAVLGVVTLLAVLFVVIAGFRYVVSAGDPQQVSKAKSGLIYSLVGLAVSIFAWGITNFVINAFVG